MIRTCTAQHDERDLCHYYDAVKATCDMPMQKRCPCSETLAPKVCPMSSHELANEKKRYWKIIGVIAFMLLLSLFLIATGALWHKWSML